ncbi:MAG: hypothetical protein Q4A19_06810 [Johnsonella sp.]|nr:hypothetical protein [Johnsonella sp.]
MGTYKRRRRRRKKASVSGNEAENRENLRGEEEIGSDSEIAEEEKRLEKEYEELGKELEKAKIDLANKYMQIMQYDMQRPEDKDETDYLSRVNELQALVKEYESILQEKEKYEALLEEKWQEINSFSEKVQESRDKKMQEELFEEIESKKSYIHKLNLELEKEIKIFQEEKVLQEKLEEELKIQTDILKDISKKFELLKENNKKQEELLLSIEMILYNRREKE